MLDFNQPLKGLDGKEVKDEKDQSILMGKLLASQLAQASKGDALKMFSWALKLHDGSPLDLDASDVDTLKEFIKNSEGSTILLKAQLLGVFKAQEA